MRGGNIMADDEKNEKRVVRIINDESLKRIYANFISVAKTSNEFNLTFCCVDPLDDKGGDLPARTVAKIAIPVLIVENTLKEIGEEFKNPKKPNSGAAIFTSKNPVY
jgi:hypothetical protein